MATPDIRVLVGVKGGAGLAQGSSGKLIKDTLTEIAQKISDTKSVKVAVAIDEKSAVTELKKALESLSTVANSFKFSPSNDGSEKLVQSYDKLIQKSEELQKLRATFDAAKTKLDATDVRADDYRSVVAEYKAAANALHTAVAAASSKEAEAANNIRSLVSIVPKLSQAMASGDLGIAGSRTEQIDEKYSGLSQYISNILQAKSALAKDSSDWINVEKIVKDSGASSDALRSLFDVLEQGRKRVATAASKGVDDAFPDNFAVRVQKSVETLRKAFASAMKGGDGGEIARAVTAINAQINGLDIDKVKDIGDILREAIGGSDQNMALQTLKTTLEEAKVPAKDIETIFKSVEKAQIGVAEQSRVIRENLIGKYQTAADNLAVGGKLNSQLASAGLNPELIASYRNQLTGLVAEFKNVGTAMDKPREKAEDLLKKIDRIASYRERLAELKSTLDSASRDYSAYQSVPYLRKGYNSVRKSIDTADSVWDAEKAAEKYAIWDDAVRKLGFDHESLRDKIREVSGEFGVTLTAAALINKVSTKMHELVDAVREVDSAMVELRKVTDASSGTYDAFLDNAKSRSREIGSSVSDLVNASALFAKMGFNLSDSFDLGTTATILANVGDEIGSVEDATNTLISVLKAYGLETSAAASVTDKLNEVSNRFPISAGGIADALQRSSAAMSAAGNTLDETISLITVANQVVNNPESVGTGWRNIALRIRGAKAELESAGEETDGIITSTSELQAKVEALTRTSSNKSGVNILTDTGAFKSTYQIIKEIGTVWKQISDINQAALLELLGGKRGAQILTSVFSNMGDLDSVTAASMDSANSAMWEHANWLDSIEAKQAQLDSAWQSFADSFMGSGFVKTAYDAGSGLLTMLTSISDTLGGLSVAAGAVTSALGLLGKDNGILTYGLKKNGEAGVTNIFRKMFGKDDNIDNIREVVKIYESLDEAQRANLATNEAYQGALSKLSAGMQNYINAGNIAGQTAEGISKGYQKMTLKAIATQAAVTALNVAISMGVSVAITLLINLITEWVTKNERAIETTKELTSALNDELDGIESYKQKATALTEELQNQALSSEEIYEKRKQLLEIQNEMVDKYGYEAAQIDILCGSVKDLTGYFDRLAESRAKASLAEGNAGFQAALDTVSRSKNYTISSSYWNSVKDLTNGQEIWDEITGWVNQNGGRVFKNQSNRATELVYGIGFDGLNSQQAKEKLTELYYYLADVEAEYGVELSAFRERLSQDISNLITDDYQQAQGVIDAYVPLLAKYDEKYKEFYQKAENAASAYTDAVANGVNGDKLKQLYNDVISAYSPDLSAFGTDEAKAVENYFNGLREQFEQMNLKTKVEVDLDKMVTIKSGASAKIKQALEDVAGLTASEVKNIGTYAGADGYVDPAERQGSGYSRLQADAYNFIAQAAQDAKVSVEQYIDALAELGLIAQGVVAVEEEQKQSMSDVSASYLERVRILSAAIAEQEQMGYISDATYKKLIQSNEDWGDAVDVSSGRVVASTEDLKKYIEEQANAGYQALVSAGATQQETEEFLRLSSAMSSLDFYDVAMSQYGGAIDSIAVALRTMRGEIELTAPEVEALAAAFPQLADQIRDGALSATDMAGLLVGSTEQIIDVMYKAINGYVFNEQEIAVLIRLYPELANAITQTAEGYQVDASAAQSAAEQKVQAANDAIQAQIVETNAVIQNIEARIAAYQMELAALGRLMDSLSQYSSGLLNGVTDYNNMTEEQKSQWQSYMQAADAAKKAKDKIASSESDLADAKDKLKGLANSLATINNSYKAASSAVKDYTSAQKGSSGATSNATKAIQDQKKALEDQRDLLKDQLDAVNDLIDLVVKMIKKEKELEKEGLKSQLDSYKELIDAQKELLSLKEDERNYEKDLNEATGKVDKIQAKINALQYDDSAEANVKRLKLYEELNDAKADLDDLNHNREVSLQEKALDEEYSRYESQLNKQIKAIEDYLSKEGQIRQDAMALIDTKSQELYNRLISYNRLYGDGVDRTVADAWTKAYAALDQYGGGVLNVLSQINGAISGLDSQIDALASAISNASSASGGLAGGLGAAVSNGLTLAQVLELIKKLTEEAAEETTDLATKQKALVKEAKQKGTPSTAVQGRGLPRRKGDIANTAIPELYHSGGIVGGAGEGETFKPRALRPDELLAVLQKGEIVMTREHQENLLDFIKGAFMTPTAAQVNVGRVAPVSAGGEVPGQVVMGDVIINGNADTSTVDAIRKAQEQMANRVFEMIQGMTRQMGYSRNVKTVSI